MTEFDIRSLSVTTAKTGELKPFATNPREHPKSQIEKMTTSILRFGFVNPILAAPDLTIIAGHARLLAAQALGHSEVPIIILPHLSEAEQRALRIADNKLSSLGDWSLDNLAIEAEFVLDAGIAPIELGFEIGELDFAIESARKKDKREKDVIEPDRADPAVSRLNDVWTIGAHRVACCDARNPESYHLVMGSDRADLVLTDMPYGVPINGHVSGLGKIRHREFPMASGEMGEDDFFEFIRTSFQNLADFSKPGALAYAFIDWRSLALMVVAGKDIFDALLNICVWVKPSGAMGSLYRSRHEMICVFRTKGGKHLNNVQLGKFGRNRTNVWEYAAANGFGSERKNLALHPTCKNVKMLADAILDSTRRGALVLDSYLGSGSTILAAHRVGRVGRGIELDPWYVDLAVERIAGETGETAVLGDGRSFSEVAAARANGEAGQ